MLKIHGSDSVFNWGQMQEPERKGASWGQAASKEGRLNPASGLTVPSRKVGSRVPDLSIL